MPKYRLLPSLCPSTRRAIPCLTPEETTIERVAMKTLEVQTANGLLKSTTETNVHIKELGFSLCVMLVDVSRRRESCCSRLQDNRNGGNTSTHQTGSTTSTIRRARVPGPRITPINDETYPVIQEWNVLRRTLAHHGLFFFDPEGEEHFEDRRKSNSQRRGDVKARSKGPRPRVHISSLQVGRPGRLCNEVGYSYSWLHGKNPTMTKRRDSIQCRIENFIPKVAITRNNELSSTASEIEKALRNRE